LRQITECALQLASMARAANAEERLELSAIKRRDQVKRAAILRAQRMAVAKAKGTHKQSEWLSIKAEFQGRCVRCGARWRILTKDHAVPVSMGGSDSADNLQPLCVPCNSGKGKEVTNWAAIRRAEGFRE
jgi:5-methylcytosine-specific restriction endonuclease McrA